MIKKKSFRWILGAGLIAIGSISILPPPDLDLLAVTAITFLGIPLKYTLIIVYGGSFLLVALGSFLIGKHISDSLKLKQYEKKFEKIEKKFIKRKSK